MSVLSIYENLKQKLYNTLHFNIATHSVIDCYLHATADAINTCKEEFEAAKNPHIYTNLTGSRIDGLGQLVNCPRLENESDSNYLTRVLSWATNNEACNATAIANALSVLTYASHAEYIPFSQGTNTATVYVIPLNYDETTIQNALSEVQSKLQSIISPDSYILYTVPEQLYVTLSVYLECKEGLDMDKIKVALTEEIKTYINEIAIGEYLAYGKINQIGNNLSGVTFFNTANIYINDIQLTALKKLQTIKQKFVFDTIYWNEVVD